MAVVRSAPALGTYIGNGSKDGNEVSFTLRLNDRKFFWLDYKSRGLTDAESVSWHSEGAYQLVAGEDSYSQTVRCEIGGLPGQARVGQVYDFEVKEGVAGAKVLVCQGINCQPQADTQDSAPRHLCEKCGKDVVGQVLKVGGMYFHPDCFTCDTCNKSLTGAFHKLPDGKKLCAVCVPRVYPDMPKQDVFPVQAPAKWAVGENIHYDGEECTIIKVDTFRRMFSLKFHRTGETLEVKEVEKKYFSYASDMCEKAVHAELASILRSVRENQPIHGGDEQDTLALAKELVVALSVQDPACQLALRDQEVDSIPIGGLESCCSIPDATPQHGNSSCLSCSQPKAMFSIL